MNFICNLRFQDRLSQQGLRIPTEIQAKAIPAILSGRNCAIQSHTGSGKTLAYVLPLLTQLLGLFNHKTGTEAMYRRLG